MKKISQSCQRSLIQDYDKQEKDGDVSEATCNYTITFHHCSNSYRLQEQTQIPCRQQF